MKEQIDKIVNELRRCLIDYGSYDRGYDEAVSMTTSKCFDLSILGNEKEFLDDFLSDENKKKIEIWFPDHVILYRIAGGVVAEILGENVADDSDFETAITRYANDYPEIEPYLEY